MANHLLFVIGASGVGKTAAVDALAERTTPGLACFHFDSLGVPTIDQMRRSFGSAERWQEATTHEWIARLQRRDEPLVLLEGQTRPSFIRAKRSASHRAVGIVLLDCHPVARSFRLRTGRQQPELDTAEMSHWAAYLRGQADALGLPIVDTTSLTPSQVADQPYARVCTLPRWAAD